MASDRGPEILAVTGAVMFLGLIVAGNVAIHKQHAKKRLERLDAQVRAGETLSPEDETYYLEHYGAYR